MKRRSNSTQANSAPATTVEILGHAVAYSYRDGYAGGMDALDKDHIAHMIGKEGYHCGEFSTADPQDPRKDHVGWWEIQKAGLTPLSEGQQRIEVLGHSVLVRFTDGWSGALGEADEEAIAGMISTDFREGEVFVQDPENPEVQHRGWWQIDWGQDGRESAGAQSESCASRPTGLRRAECAADEQ